MPTENPTPDIIGEILKGSEYFYCEKLHCRLKIDICLQRQQINLDRHINKSIPFWHCQDCEQGKENKRLKEGGVSMSQERPTESKDKTQKPETDQKKLCEKCGERPTLNKYSKYCSPCLNAFRWANKKGPDAPKVSKSKKAKVGKAKPEKAPKTATTAFTIDFGKHISILDEIEKIADEEMRPVDMQIIYILKKYLDNILD